jgi:hypothetical protein
MLPNFGKYISQGEWFTTLTEMAAVFHLLQAMEERILSSSDKRQNISSRSSMGRSDQVCISNIAFLFIVVLLLSSTTLADNLGHGKHINGNKMQNQL